MFKKRDKANKQDLNADIQAIQVDADQEKQDEVPITIPKSMMSKKINKFSNKTVKESTEPIPKTVVRYGLIDKSEVNSKFHANQQVDEPKKAQPNSLINIYVKKKMEEMTKGNNQKQNDQQANDEIIEMQRKYLETNKQKLQEFDIGEIQKKLQNMANKAIKNELQARNSYLKDLLENQHERAEYASKKELKTLRQEQQRLQKQFESKYNEKGRRSYVQKTKYQAMLGK